MATKKTKRSTPRRTRKAKPAAFFTDMNGGLRVLEIAKAGSSQEADEIGAEKGLIPLGFGRVWPDDGIAAIESSGPLRYDPSTGAVEGVLR